MDHHDLDALHPRPKTLREDAEAMVFAPVLLFVNGESAFTTIENVWAVREALEAEECAAYDMQRATLESLATSDETRAELLSREEAVNAAHGTADEAAAFDAYQQAASAEQERLLALMDRCLGVYTLMRSRWSYLAKVESFGEDARQGVPAGVRNPLRTRMFTPRAAACCCARPLLPGSSYASAQRRRLVAIIASLRRGRPGPAGFPMSPRVAKQQ